VILSAYPKKRPAERTARELVRSGLVGCATVTYGARAYYRWNGKNREDTSTLLWGKTTSQHAAEAVRAIGAAHPDDVPEILVLPATGGHAPYLDWLAQETGNGGASPARADASTSRPGRAARRNKAKAR